MFKIVVFAIIIFGAAWYLGRRYSGWSGWEHIDLFYYPIGAVGVILLFLLNTAERQRIELIEDQRAHDEVVHNLAQQRPEIDAGSAYLIESSLSLFSSISEMADACSGVESNNPKCPVAVRLAPVIDDFLAEDSETARKSNSEEHRLASTCLSVESLLIEVRNDQLLTPLVSDLVLTHYSEGKAKDFSRFEYDPAHDYVAQFVGRLESTIASVRSVLDQDPEIGKRIRAMYRAEGYFATTIMMGSIPCLMTSGEDFKEFADWNTKLSSASELRQAAQQDADDLGPNPPKPEGPFRFSLFYWPFFLILAFGLKFAKAAARLKLSS